MELSGLTRHVPVWHLTILSLVSFFQVKLTGTFPDHEAPGHPIEATLSGLLCVRHSASHFVSTRRKPISEMDCYNYGELGHLAHQCPKPKKDKYKKKYKGKKDDSNDDDDNEKKKNKPYKKKDVKKKEFHKKKKNGKVYIVGD